MCGYGGCLVLRSICGAGCSPFARICCIGGLRELKERPTFSSDWIPVQLDRNGGAVLAEKEEMDLNEASRLRNLQHEALQRCQDLNPIPADEGRKILALFVIGGGTP